MRRRRISIIVLICASAALGLGAWVIASATARASVTCTNDAGVARTWTTASGRLQFGGAGSASASAAAPKEVSAADKAAYHAAIASPAQVIAQLQQVYVGDAIDNGVDPVTAARQFGPWTVPGATGAQLDHAMEPATYGWHCP